MNLNKFLTKLKDDGVNLWVQKGILHYRCNKEKMDTMTYSMIKDNKNSIINVLSNLCPSTEFKNSTITRMEHKNAEYPLSYAQNRLWYFECFNRNQATYNIPISIRLEGQFNQRAFAEALWNLVRKHAVLRTSFHGDDGICYQRVHRKISIPLEYINVEHLTQIDKEDAVEYLGNKLFSTPIDLFKPHVFRIVLIKLSENIYHIVFVIHHLIFDGWSLNLLIKDLTEFYNNEIKKVPYDVAFTELQYSDYALWQYKQVKKGQYQSGIDWFKNKFTSSVPYQLRPDFPQHGNHNTQSYQGAQERLILNLDESENISVQANKNNCSNFSIVLSAIAIVISYELKTSEVILGTDVSGRNQLEFQSLIGFFSNQLPLRISTDRNMKFSAVVDNSKQALASCLKYAEIPFDYIVEQLNVPRDRGIHPLFQIKVVSQPRLTSINFSGLDVKIYGLKNNTSKFGLLFNVFENYNVINIITEYNSTQYGCNKIKRLLEQIHMILKLSSLGSDFLLKRVDQDLLAIDEKWLAQGRNLKIKSFLQSYSESRN